MLKFFAYFNAQEKLHFKNGYQILDLENIY